MPRGAKARRRHSRAPYRVRMAWWKRSRKGERRGPSDGPNMTVDQQAVRRYLQQFVESRRGVEAYVEPPTNVTATTVILIAHDGEWTRRRVPSVGWAHDFANRLGVPSYDAAVVGVPQRMRDYNRRQKTQKAPNPFSSPAPPEA